MSDGAPTLEAMSEPELLLWCDVETTGLLPEEDTLLEAGLMLTRGLVEVAATSVVIKVPGVRRIQMAARAREMHEDNGLFDAVETSNISLPQAERQLIRWVDAHNARGLWMVGTKIGFDREWLDAHMPTLASLWHFRGYDMLTLRRFWGEKRADTPHRTLPDLRANVAALQRYAKLRKLAMARQAIQVA